MSSVISNAVVGLVREYTGRGPTGARTTIDSDTIVVTLRDSLTKGEQKLTECGQGTQVLSMRRAFHATMRSELVAAVEKATGRTVEACLSDNLCDPDIAVEIFLMVPEPNGATTARVAGSPRPSPMVLFASPTLTW